MEKRKRWRQWENFEQWKYVGQVTARFSSWLRNATLNAAPQEISPFFYPNHPRYSDNDLKNRGVIGYFSITDLRERAHIGSY